ncbi:acyl-CoA dehydratase activase [Syntrophorhabdus aromaticivorans]|uniref:acyl-CoA dehydratase activase n=1 Tax=Syntrophorhabdus aromaticivorans TaxID=328301 RepID=UPI00040D5DEA|nr:acyl-CoA dehydratase activase [Syntrophorhabdus aromaticivorans]
MHRIGIDIGSISVSVIIMDSKDNILESRYIRHRGRPFQVGRDILEELSGQTEIEFVAATGTGAREFAFLVGASFVNEIVALAKGFSHLYPDVESVIDIGGEDSKLIMLEKGEKDSGLRVKDFSMNALCAAGTGSFLDQQASRLCFSIEEFSEIALKSTNPPRIAGRCTVFAKSDMIHLQQIATPDYEIVAGLCYALARNFKGNIAKGKDVRHPVAFVGGVAANAGMRRALKDVFSLGDGQFFVPEHFTAMGAIGAVYAVLDKPDLKTAFCGLRRLDEYLAAEYSQEAHEPLEISPKNMHIPYDMKTVSERTTVYLGVDVGSISTNLVVIDKDRNVLAKRYLMTEGRPLEAVKRGLAEIGAEIGDMIDIAGAGTTGSGRYLTADFIGADIVRNEITAQAEAAIAIDSEVDTVFEIGGQDSKYISVDNGVIVDFEMNKACAAGTGSFLEEQAERLGISIKEEFGALALSSKKPVRMGERCTVFIESDLVHHQQRGARTDDIVSGLSYSIVTNYLNKVVGDRRVGSKIFFQGGTAFNKGVVAAFEKTLSRPISVPPHHDVTGAIGVAILAMKEKTWNKSTFKGFDLSKRPYDIETFECKGCENLCEIRRVTVENETPLYYGSRCEKYDVVRRSGKKDIRDLFKVRNELLNTVYDRSVDGEPLGVPKILNMHELLPFWKAFLTELGFSLIFSDPTNKKTIREGVENIIVETCFPIKLTHGHILNVIKKGAKRLFIPSVINLRRPSGNVPNTFACPYAQTIPYTAKASIDFQALGVTVHTPVVYFGRGREVAEQNLIAFGKKMGRSKKAVQKALALATEAQDTFYRETARIGQEALSSLPNGSRAMVIIGRPYNSADPGANLNIHKKLMDLGVMPVPIDMLPGIEDVEGDDDLEHMYWGYGQKILRAAKAIKDRDDLHGIYITSFGCGPDSFIAHFFKRAIAGKPFLQLEIDEHSADAGIVTRLEAFLDSIKNARAKGKTGESPAVVFGKKGESRRVYIPYMSDHAFGLASAFKASGVDAVVMDESDADTVYWGRKYTTGKECYPCILTTGDMVKTVKKGDFEPDRSAFFMPSGNGPCRFGQYHRFHRMVLDEVGFANVPIYSPNQDHRLYKDLNILGGEFSRLGWRAIVATDLLIKMLHAVRPHEVRKGDTEKAYREAIETVSATILAGSDDGMTDTLHSAVKRFLGVERTSKKRPVVGIVGEVYVRSNRFANSNVIKKVEEFGGEVWLAPITEWISYVNYISRSQRSMSHVKLSNRLKLMLTQYMQNREEHRIEHCFKGHLRYAEEPRMEEVLRKASPYLHVSFEGEAILTVGKTIDFIDKGASGIINTMPFTCMPGNISSAIMRIIQKKYHVPIINLAYDGQGLTNISARLEAFMYQVKEYWENHE